MTAVLAKRTRAAVGNRWLERDYVVAGESLVRSVVRNRIAGTVVDCGRAEFRLEIEDRVVTAAECRLAAVERPVPAGIGDGEELQLRFAVNDLPVEIEIHVAAPAERPWLYKRVSVTNRGARPITIYTASIEWFTPSGERFTYAVEDVELEHPRISRGFHEAVGQPVFTESLFWGLEFPHSLSGRAPDGELRLLHFPGKQIAPGERWQSKRAVVGAARTDGVADAFDQYCLSLRPFKDPYRFVNWQCCWLAIPPTYEEGKPLLQFLKQRLVDECGGRLDAFDLSAMCWTFGIRIGYEPEGLWQPTEADVHERMSAECRAAGIPYGMYFNANSFLPFDNTKEWGERQGFGFADETSYCLAEPRYRQAITERVVDCVERYQLGVVTFDMMWQGNGFGCAVEGHGHLVDAERDPIGRFGTEAVIEAHLDLFAKLRRVNPDIIVSMMTYDCWGSPWWLPYADVVHSVASDTQVSHATISPRFRDHLIAARDEQLYDMYVVRNRKLPMWGNDSFMGLQVRREFIGQSHPLNADDPKEQWEDELIMGTAGHLHAAFLNCVDHRILDETSSGIPFYANVLKWAEAHRWTLFDTRLILGDPRAGEPVGYAHRGEDETILCLRNNSMTTTSADVEIAAELLPLGGAEELAATLIYPARQELADGLAIGSRLQLTLEPHQAYVVQLQREPNSTEPRIRGVRHHLRSLNGRQLDVDVWGPAGTNADISVSHPLPTRRTEGVAIAFPGAGAKPATWSLDGPIAANGGFRITTVIEVGDAATSQLQIYLDGGLDGCVDPNSADAVKEQTRTLEEWIELMDGWRKGSVETREDATLPPRVVIRHEVGDSPAPGGQAVRHAVEGSTQFRPRTAPTLSHSWHLVDLKPGRNRVQVDVATAPGQPRLGIWLESLTPLVHKTLRLTMSEDFSLSPQLPPWRPEVERRVAAIRPLQPLEIA